MTFLRWQSPVGEEGLGIANVLKEAGLVASTSEAMRMLKQNAVKLDSEKVSDKSIKLSAGQVVILQVGKRRIAKVTME